MNRSVSQVNSELQTLQTALIRQHDALLARLSEVDSEKEMLAISLEMDELYLRIRVCTRLLFRKTGEEIDAEIGAVVEASDALKESIAKVKKLTNLIELIGKFLGLVDVVLDKVKLL